MSYGFIQNLCIDLLAWSLEEVDEGGARRGRGPLACEPEIT
jgi:hypothetical protein